MTGTLYINGKDAYNNYGVYLSHNSFNDLITLPAFKDLTTNDWQEEDGEEVDLSNPVLSARSVQLSFNISDATKLDTFLAYLTEQPYRTFYFPILRRTYKLRLVAMASFQRCAELGIFSLKFSDDFPPVVVPSTYTRAEITALKKQYDSAVQYLEQSPSTSLLVPSSGLSLDGVDLARFGIYALKGIDNALGKAPEVKEALIRSSKQVAGQTYDKGGAVHFKALDLSLPLLMHPATIDAFWTQWTGLLTLLLAPELHTITYEPDGKKLTGYYKGAKVSSFDPHDPRGPWLQFQLTFRVTQF